MSVCKKILPPRIVHKVAVQGAFHVFKEAFLADIFEFNVLWLCLINLEKRVSFCFLLYYPGFLHCAIDAVKLQTICSESIVDGSVKIQLRIVLLHDFLREVRIEGMRRAEDRYAEPIFYDGVNHLRLFFRVLRCLFCYARKKFRRQAASRKFLKNAVKCDDMCEGLLVVLIPRCLVKRHKAPSLSEQDAVLKLNHRLHPVLRMFLELIVKRLAAVHVRAIFDKFSSSSSLNFSNRFHWHNFAPPFAR